MKTLSVIILILTSRIFFGQELNKIVIDDISEKPILIGEVTRDAFNDSSFSWWFNSEYENYDVDTDALEPVIHNPNYLDDVYIIAAIGTWCSDSRRELPRFLKIIDAINLNEEQLEMIAVDEDKEAEGDELSDLNIEFIPTFIIYKGDAELGRIVEAPEESLETDLIKYLIPETIN